MFSPTGPQFEEEVRNICRNLYANGIGQGSSVVDGRERDGIFWNGQFFTVVEATTMRTRDKAETDGKKTHELVMKLRQEGEMARGLLVTLHEPTHDQREILKSKKYDRTTRIISFDELRSQLFDSLTYINNREKKRFGSVFDHVENNFNIPFSDFVEPTILDVPRSSPITFKGLSSNIRRGSRYLMLAEYGVGKSMLIRHLFHTLVQKFRNKEHFRTPIAINLREHLGQTDPIELLERHARANAVPPQSLVAAWNAGYVDLLIDGFDELTTRGWTGDIRRLKEYRRMSHSVVRKLIKETPNNSSVLITGREAYFDSISEMREALGADEGRFPIIRVFSFDDQQSAEYLKKKGFNDLLPDWVPTRPLLLTYLVNKGLLKPLVDGGLSGDFPRGSAWLSLIDMIAGRESEQLEGVDKEAFLLFFGALGIRARHVSGGLSSFSPQMMEDLFTRVTGVTIMEDERNLLVRLPGLGAAQDNPLNRSFIDHDFMNAACAVPVLKYVFDPYSDQTALYQFDGIIEPMNETGIEALATMFVRAGLQIGVVTAAVTRAIGLGLGQLAYDVFQTAQYFGTPKGEFDFTGVAIDEIDLTNGSFESVKLKFSDCIVNRLILPAIGERFDTVSFQGCLIGTIDGRVSFADLDSSQFRDCEVQEFTDEYSVNSEILDTTLPLGVRLLIVSLRKLFTQSGSSRLESAFYRGLDQRSKMLVPDILSLMARHGFMIESSRKGKTAYTGTKSKRGEALKIIQAPNSAVSGLLRECAKVA